MTAREDRYIFDTGASKHALNTSSLSEEEKKHIRPLPQAVVVDTCNGPIVIDSYIELQLDKLGATRPLRFNVSDNSPNLISIGQLVLQDGFKFHWEGKRARLVSPSGDVTWIDPIQNVPEMDLQGMVVNKINEIEADQLLAAKTQRIVDDPLRAADQDHQPFGKNDLPKGLFYLELFMGSGRLSQSLKRRLESVGRQDIQVIGFELSQGRSGDLLQNDTFQRVMALINSGRCLGVWMAPPCSTWSTSRRHDEHKGAPPLRSRDHVMGLPSLDARQRRTVQKANALVQRCTDFAVACILNAVPFAIENPEKSLMWEAVQVRHVAALSNVKRTRYDFCQFGEAYHKATRILSWGYQAIGERARTCSGRGGLCSRTGAAHELLTGVVECPPEFEHLLGSPRPDEEGKPRMIWKTKLAEPYPHEFCDEMASQMIAHPKVGRVGLTPEQMGVPPPPAPPLSAAGNVLQRPPKSHYLTHFPKHPGCETCNLAKATKKRAARVDKTKVHESAAPPPKDFGDLVTADHVVFSQRDASHDNKRFLLSVYDRATQWVEATPCPAKDSATTKMALRDFMGSKPLKLLYSDNSGEIKEAAKSLGWMHDTSTDNRPQTNGVIERQNRNILEGLRCTLYESGLEHKFWSQAVVTWCILNNITKGEDMNMVTPWMRRHGAKTKFGGQLVPFGAKVHYLPSADRELAARQKAAPRMVEGLFAGYKLLHDARWNGEYLVYDRMAYENWDGRCDLPLHTTKELYVPGSTPDSCCLEHWERGGTCSREAWP